MDVLSWFPGPTACKGGIEVMISTRWDAHHKCLCSVRKSDDNRRLIWFAWFILRSSYDVCVSASQKNALTDKACFATAYSKPHRRSAHYSERHADSGGGRKEVPLLLWNYVVRLHMYQRVLHMCWWGDAEKACSEMHVWSMFFHSIRRISTY